MKFTSTKAYSIKVVGTAEKNTSLCARTVMAFMVKSVFGDYKEIVRLLPLIRPTGGIIHSLTSSVIQFVQSLGFRILVIITDNNRVNQNMFNLFSREDHFFVNPQFPDSKIYLQYDTVHLFKNIRNNW